MQLSEQQKKFLRRAGHQLKPVVLIGGAGLSDSVRAELEQALDHHELIKVRVRVADRAERDAIIGQICEQSGAELVLRIGNVALLFRRNPERPRLELPG